MRNECGHLIMEKDDEGASSEPAKDVKEESASEAAFKDWLNGKELIIKNVYYCGVCSTPTEYCEYSDEYAACKEWLAANPPPESIFDVASTAAAVDDISLEEGEGEKGEGEKKKKKKRGGAANKAKKQAELVLNPDVTIVKQMRAKRKYVTCVYGLESCGIKLKDATKACGKKFSCGSSVSETPAGDKVVIIQGDVILDLPEFLTNKLNVPADCIKIRERK